MLFAHLTRVTDELADSSDSKNLNIWAPGESMVIAQSPSPGSKLVPMNEVVLTVAPITIGTAG